VETGGDARLKSYREIKNTEDIYINNNTLEATAAEGLWTMFGVIE